MPLTAQLNTLAFVKHPDGERVLMCHRIARGHDEQFGKFNGLGGKLEPDEDAVACIVRELGEEAGITPTQLRLRGTVSWPGFGSGGRNDFGFVFVVDAFTGEVPERNDEGELSWQRIDALDSLPMWEGDRFFLPLVFDDAVEQFHAVIPYADGRPTGFSCTVLPLPGEPA